MPSRGGGGADAVYGQRPAAEQLGRGRHRGPHLPADAQTTKPDRCQGARAMKPTAHLINVGARQGRRRDGPDPRAAGEAHRRCRPRRDAGGAAAGRLAAVGHAQRAASRRTPPARRSATRTGHRHPAGEPRPPVARRDDAAEPDRLGHTYRIACAVEHVAGGGWQPHLDNLSALDLALAHGLDDHWLPAFDPAVQH